MAKKRIIANFMHETEEAAAKQFISDAVSTESYIMGTIDEKDIPKLEAKGLIIQEIKEPTLPETPGAGAEPVPGFRRPGSFGLEVGVGAPGPAIDEARPNFYLIQFTGPLVESWKAQLANLEVALLEYIPQNSYTARLAPDQAKKVQALPFVAMLRVYQKEDTGPISPVPRMETRGWEIQPKKARAITIYDLRLHRDQDLPTVLEQLKGLGVNVAGSAGRKVRVYLMENDPLADTIADLPEVAGMEEFVPPKLHNDLARVLLGVDPNPAAGLAAGIPYTGDGEIVGIADTGLDDTHPDFKARIVRLVALGRPGDTSDPNGHGTHVAGSVLGSGSSSNGKLRGVAPDARLFFQSLLDSDGELGGLPLDLSTLFDEAYQAGARIHNNSWGAATRSMYTFNSIEVDEFVANHRDMLVVISAGNEGTAANCLNSQAGFVDWLSIGSPASSKNALTVGASRSSRTSGGYSTWTYGATWPRYFPDSPIKDEKVSGDAESMAAFSSRGPCDDRRIKPDVVAPGTDIVSTRSSKAPLNSYWAPYSGNSRYAFMGGTSMAAPLVTGCAVLVREYYVKQRNHLPSAALLKATLINGTRTLSGTDAQAQYPMFHQGFGAIYLPSTLPNQAFPNMKLEFLDTWQTPALIFDRTGQRFRYQVSVAAGTPLRITMAYTDLPARALQNNLNLYVQHLGSGQKWTGNENMPFSLKIPDADNNVEILRLDQPVAGDYLIQISAANLLQTGQDFALVVTGDLTSTLTKYVWS